MSLDPVAVLIVGAVICVGLVLGRLRNRLRWLHAWFGFLDWAVWLGGIGLAVYFLLRREWVLGAVVLGYVLLDPPFRDERESQEGEAPPPRAEPPPPVPGAEGGLARSAPEAEPPACARGDGRDLARLASNDARLSLGGEAFDRLAQVIDPSDTVLAIAYATDGGKWWKEFLPGSYLVVVATDRRLLLVPAVPLLGDGPITVEARAVAYRDLSDVQERIGKLRSRLVITTARETIRLSNLRAASARRLSQAIRECV